MAVTGFAGDAMTSGFTMGVEMKWTNEKPSVEGWYFWKRRIKDSDSFHWGCYFYERGTEQFWLGGSESAAPNGGQWAGPIPEPYNES